MSPVVQPPLGRSRASFIVPSASCEIVLSSVAPGGKLTTERRVPSPAMTIERGLAPAPSRGTPGLLAIQVARRRSSAGPELIGVSDGGVDSVGGGVAVASPSNK